MHRRDARVWPVAFGLALLAADPARAQPAPPGGRLTIEQALQEARAHPDVAAARAVVDGAGEARQRMSALDNPLVDVRLENWSFGGGSTPLDAFATATQAIPIGGRRGAGYRLAEAERDVAGAAAATTLRGVLGAVADRFVAALATRGWAEDLTRQSNEVAELVRVLERRVDEGAAAEGDLARVRAELGRLDLQRVRARVDLARQLGALGALLGRPAPPAPSDLAAPDPDHLGARLAAGRAGIEGAVERHPSVALARAAAARATSQLDLEDARGRPDLLVTGGYKRTVHRSTGVAGVGLALPLFDRNGPARARAAADLNAARFTLEATRTRVRAELTAQVEAARALSAESGPLDASLASAAVARQAARARFAEGRSDVLGLVDAERLWLDTTRDLIAIRTDALLAALHALLGLDDPFTP